MFKKLLILIVSGLAFHACREDNKPRKTMVCDAMFVHSVIVVFEGFDEEVFEQLDVRLTLVTGNDMEPISMFRIGDQYYSNFNGGGEMSLEINFRDELLAAENFFVERGEGQCHPVQVVLNYECFHSIENDEASCESGL